MELKNSKRILNSASWVTVKLDDIDKRHIATSSSGAYKKAALIRAMNLTPETIDRLASRGSALLAQDHSGHLSKTLELVRQVATNSISHTQLAQAAAFIPAEALVGIAKSISWDKSSPFDLLLQIFEQQQHVSPIGWLYLERIEMYPVGVERGEMVFTVALAPGETQTISHKEWATSAQTYESIVQDYFEAYSEKGVAEKTDASMSTENESRHSSVLNFGATLSAGYGPVSLTTTFGLSNTRDERDSAKQSFQRNREATEKASSRARQEHKVSVKLEERKGTEDNSFKTIQNTTADAMRIDYYRMMRKWRTDLLRYGLRLTYDITIPTPGARFWARWQRLAELEELIRRPFVFGLKPKDVTDASWATLAANAGISLEAPPEPKMPVSINRVMEEKQWGDPIFEFVAPPGYQLGNGVAGTIAYWGPSGFPTFYFSAPSQLTQSSGGSASGVYEAKIDVNGGVDRFTVTIMRSSEFRTVLALHAGAIRIPDSYVAWQVRAWTQLRDTAQALFQEENARLQAERDRLYRSLVAKDTLSLRLLEREEILRLVMLWLLGPTSWYSNAPAVVDATIARILSNERALLLGLPPSTESPTFAGVSSADWSNSLLFGDIVRYIHQAIEWENLLYFLYPYYWGSETQGRDKVLFEHPDAEHEKFLRAGYARVVITVRPGFETDFVNLMETGTLSASAITHYQSVAQDIQNTARTNFSNTPPANPEKHTRPLLTPQQRKTWDIMQAVMLTIDAYLTKNEHYPATLADLPAGTVTKDAWGNDLVYKLPGESNDYDLISLGADGAEGGTDAAEDISAAAGASLIASWFDYTPTSGIDIVVTTPPNLIA